MVPPASQSTDCPRLPDWLPVLRREPDAVQVGLDPDTGIVLTGVPHGTEQWLAMLDGRHPPAEIAAGASRLGITSDRAGWMLRMLESAGLLQHHPGADRQRAQVLDHSPIAGPAASDRSTRRFDHDQVRLVGSGVLARAVAENLITAGIGRLYLADIEPGVAGPGSAALQRQLLSEASATRLQIVQHWSKPDHPDPELTVIAADVAEPPRGISESYARCDQRHLAVRPMLGGAVVGPMVHPGRTPCLSCLDHLRRDADPGWPGLLDQLNRRCVPLSPFLAHWAGVTATVQVLTALAGEPVGTVATTIEMTPDTFCARVRRWPMHPACGCAWRD